MSVSFLYNEKYVKIIDMPKLWRKNPNLILYPSLNIVSEENLDEPGIDGHNFTTTEYDTYNALVEEYNTWMTETLRENINADGNTFETMKNPIKTTKSPVPEIPIVHEQEPVYYSTMDEDVPIRVVKQTIKKPKKSVDLDDKLKHLEAGKVINVSGINEYGIGTRVVLFKNPKMFVTRDERVMSTKYEAFEMFVNLLVKDKYKKRYTKELALAQRYFNIKPPKPKKEKSES